MSACISPPRWALGGYQVPKDMVSRDHANVPSGSMPAEVFESLNGFSS